MEPGSGRRPFHHGQPTIPKNRAPRHLPGELSLFASLKARTIWSRRSCSAPPGPHLNRGEWMHCDQRIQEVWSYTTYGSNRLLYQNDSLHPNEGSGLQPAEVDARRHDPAQLVKAVPHSDVTARLADTIDQAANHPALDIEHAQADMRRLLQREHYLCNVSKKGVGVLRRLNPGLSGLT
jgi:hypothetical protein